MQLKVGSYSFPANSAAVTTETEILWNDGGQPYAVRRRLRADGWIDGTSQGNITANLAAADAALKTPYQDIVLAQDDGSDSAVVLRNAGSITGVQVTGGLSLPDMRGAAYVNTIHYTFTAWAEYPLAGTSNLLLTWTEVVELWGGGPLRDVFPCVNAPPQEQVLWPQVPYEATQRGTIVGYTAYPPAPSPKFPAALREAGRFSRRSPKRRGNGYQEFTLDYAYVFKAATPLVAIPSLWAS